MRTFYKLSFTLIHSCRSSARFGVDASRLSFYSARHTYATALDEKGVSMGLIRDLLGHDDERTTRDYVKRKSQRVLDAADELLSI